MAIKIRIAGVEGDISSISQDISRLEDYMVVLENAIVERISALSKLTAALSGAQSILSSDNNELYDKSVKDLENVKSKLAGLDEYKQKLQFEIKLLDDDRNNLTAEMNRAVDKKYQEEMTLAKIDTDLETLQERIFEEYELTYSSCEPYRQEDYNLHDGLVQTSVLKKDIGRLGYVNVNAIEEARLVGERFFDMDNQAQDLIKAKEDLMTIIKELAVEMITRFEKEFTQIQANFSKTFKELFGGGNARLELVPSEDGDPLNAGVDIVAEPPGKKLQSISLLSGGEKALTAIAILFAILRLRPMPFCLLDEIEAALDDSNVERFANYLKRFSQDTQFIVITHRKPTMELADRLYGVTMEEKGVSRVVAVNLSDAIKTAK
jgi:chromosome segregation protein